MAYYLSIDIGASSGRHILGSLENGNLVISEVYRFKNGYTKKSGRLCWDTHALFGHILKGLARCKEIGKAPASVGIDTWGVDFVLLDKADNLIGQAVAYRDNRTDGMDKLVEAVFSEQELYERSGIQKMPFNTVYQLMAVKAEHPDMLEQARGFFLTPEYYSYLLCGVKMHEYTMASTTGLVSAGTNNWDFELIEKLGLPAHLFGNVCPPGTKLGKLRPEIAAQIGFECDVVFPCTHDTGSAVVATPLDKDSVYLSSGTWSLVGVELESPITTPQSRLEGLTNEGGFGYRYRYLKNIMGLWILQQIKAELGEGSSFADICEAAKKAEGFESRIDVNDLRFMAPRSMSREIKDACLQSGQKVPANINELSSLVYQSLADSYAQTVRALETLTGKGYSTIRIVGGGSQDKYLNQLTARACCKKVIAGPVEGTAIGNILVQMMSMGEIDGVSAARQLVMQSFPMDEYS